MSVSPAAEMKNVGNMVASPLPAACAGNEAAFPPVTSSVDVLLFSLACESRAAKIGCSRRPERLPNVVAIVNLRNLKL